MLVAQSHPTLFDSMDCSPIGSSVHGILQARILEWVSIPFSRGSSWPRNWTKISPTFQANSLLSEHHLYLDLDSFPLICKTLWYSNFLSRKGSLSDISSGKNYCQRHSFFFFFKIKRQTDSYYNVNELTGRYSLPRGGWGKALTMGLRSPVEAADTGLSTQLVITDWTSILRPQTPQHKWVVAAKMREEQNEVGPQV